MTCQYSGCNYPEGECSGECLAAKNTKTDMTHDTNITLEEIAARAIGYDGHGDSRFLCDSDDFKKLLSDPAILNHVPGYVALREENERLKHECDLNAQLSEQFKMALSPAPYGINYVAFAKECRNALETTTQSVSANQPDSGKVTAPHIGSFFSADALAKATMTPKQERAAAAGYCPKCGTRHLEMVSEGGGMSFHQCRNCKQIVVLSAAPVDSVEKS